MDLAKASPDDFARLIDETFAVDVENMEPLTLTEVETKQRIRPGGRRPFALIFRGTGSDVLPQRLYRLQHNSTGAMEIFLVPIAEAEDHVLYEAVFT